MVECADVGKVDPSGVAVAGVEVETVDVVFAAEGDFLNDPFGGCHRWSQVYRPLFCSGFQLGVPSAVEQFLQ